MNLKTSLLFALLSAMAFTFTSCGDDDDDGGLPLEGTLWTETNYKAENCTDPDDNEDAPQGCTANECYKIRLSNGTITFTDTEGGLTETTTQSYTLSGNVIKLNIGGFNLDVTYSISGSTLTIKLKDPFEGCDITTTYSGV